VSENPGQGPRGSHNFDELARGLASGSVSRRRALKLFAGAAVGALIPSRALAQTCPGNQVLICHRPPGNPSNEQEKCVGQNALDRHLANHPCDCEGPCSECEPCSPPSPPGPPGPPPPPEPCREGGERCGEGRPECCGNLKCIGLPGHKHCRRRHDDECRERGERCGEGRPECCGNLKCIGLPGHKHCRRIRRDDPEDPG